MHLLRVLTTFAVVLVAELPDKSLFASLLLATRYRARWVWLGISAAFLTHVVIAVSAGRLLHLLPARAVEAIITLLFALGAVLLLMPERPAEPHAEAEEISERVGRAPTAWRVVITCFAVVFVGEWGDVTQIVTADLSARYADPLSVGIGAALGLVTAATIAVFAGNRLLIKVPLPVVRRIGGVVLAGFALASAVRLLV